MPRMIFLIKTLAPVLLLLVSSCSVQDLYQSAIKHERSKANLMLKQITLDYGKISYLDNNIDSDSTLVLLHGFGGDKDNWNRLSSELINKHRIIIPDLPGHGDSISDLNITYTISQQTRMLSTFLKKIGIVGFHLAGNSMGGAVALQLTKTNPHAIKTLTLFNPLGIQKVKSELDKMILQTNKNPMFDICTEEKLNTLLDYGMHKKLYIPGIFMSLLVSDKCNRSSIEKKVYLDMYKDADFSESIKTITTPTLIIWGALDRILHVDNAPLFKSGVKNSKLIILKETGHVPLIERPEKSASILENHITTHLKTIVN